MAKQKYGSLAELISTTRQSLGLTRDGLAYKANLDANIIYSVEEGYDLFLPPTIRQKLAHALKLENKEIKKYEKRPSFEFAKKSDMDSIREQILMNYTNPEYEIFCPICGEKLVTRVAKLYDLEDNLVLRAKANCPKCPFQLKD